VELSDQQARKVGAILGGAFFKPAVMEELEAVFGSLLIDWVTLEEASPGAGKTIGELQIRRRTGVTIVAIVRDDQAIPVPEPSELLRAGDRLVIIGRRQDSGPFHKLVVG
jgi:TrkA domain protein